MYPKPLKTPLLKSMQVLGLAELRVPGVEADDVIGTVATRAVDAGFHVAIASPDKVRTKGFGGHAENLSGRWAEGTDGVCPRQTPRGYAATHAIFIASLISHMAGVCCLLYPALKHSQPEVKGCLALYGVLQSPRALW